MKSALFAVLSLALAITLASCGAGTVPVSAAPGIALNLPSEAKPEPVTSSIFESRETHRPRLGGN